MRVLTLLLHMDIFFESVYFMFYLFIFFIHYVFLFLISILKL